MYVQSKSLSKVVSHEYLILNYLHITWDAMVLYSILKSIQISVRKYISNAGFLIISYKISDK